MPKEVPKGPLHPPLLAGLFFYPPEGGVLKMYFQKCLCNPLPFVGGVPFLNPPEGGLMGPASLRGGRRREDAHPSFRTLRRQAHRAMSAAYPNGAWTSTSSGPSRTEYFQKCFCKVPEGVGGRSARELSWLSFCNFCFFFRRATSSPELRPWERRRASTSRGCTAPPHAAPLLRLPNVVVGRRGVVAPPPRAR